MAIIGQVGHGTPDQPRSLFTNPGFAESSLSCRPDPKLTSTSARLIRYDCHVLRHPIAVDTPLPTRTLPTATPAPTALYPTGTQGVVVTTLSKMLGRPQWPLLVRSGMARPTRPDHYLRIPIRISSLSCRPDPKHTSTSLRLILYHCHVLRDPIADDTPLPTRTLPTATPAPTAPSTGTQGVVVTTLSRRLGRPQCP